jgi:hypothetical protein
VPLALTPLRLAPSPWAQRFKPDEGGSFVIDMTDRKQAEEKLRASEQRLLDRRWAN